jgi:rhodanese-related sulfurtransferase
MAARALAAQGYKNVREFSGGKREWAEAGYSLQGDHPEDPFPQKKDGH